MDSIKTWAPGSFLPKECKGMTDAEKGWYLSSDALKVRPSYAGDPICVCTAFEDAQWVADRLNLAAELESRLGDGLSSNTPQDEDRGWLEKKP